MFKGVFQIGKDVFPCYFQLIDYLKDGLSTVILQNLSQQEIHGKRFMNDNLL